MKVKKIKFLKVLVPIFILIIGNGTFASDDGCIDSFDGTHYSFGESEGSWINNESGETVESESIVCVKNSFFPPTNGDSLKLPNLIEIRGVNGFNSFEMSEVILPRLETVSQLLHLTSLSYPTPELKVVDLSSLKSGQAVFTISASSPMIKIIKINRHYFNNVMSDFENTKISIKKFCVENDLLSSENVIYFDCKYSAS